MNRFKIPLAVAMLVGPALAGASSEKPYKIVSVDKKATPKCSVEVRLPVEVSKEQLSDYASAIRRQYCPSTLPVFISYWLPGMEVGTGAWATTHFNPQLEVIVYGLTPQTKNKLAANIPNGMLVGRWDDGTAGAIISILRIGSSYVEETAFSDGSKLRHRLTQKGNAKYVDLESDEGDFSIIDAKGNLRLYDRSGYIRTASKLTKQ